MRHSEQPAPALIDIGANLSHRQFRKDLPAVLDNAAGAGISDCILTGTSVDVSAEVLELCRTLASDARCGLYCTAGIHPHDARQMNPDSLARLRELATAPEVVAIGETGLDFNRDFSPRPEQERAFEAQLQLAIELQLPVFLHERDAHDRQLAILRQYRDHLCNAVVHCFTGDRRALFNYLDLDLHIGITGWICDDRRGRALRPLVASIGLDRLMLETDCPYLLPGTIPDKPQGRRNEPAFLPWVLAMVAANRPESIETVARATSATARRFFRLPQR